MTTQREIRFRVWDGKAFVPDDYMPWLRYDGQLWSQSCCHWGSDEERCEGLLVDQFTGFKDSCGTPIYENDIVNFTNRGVTHGPEPEYVKNALVWFDDACGCWTFGKWFDTSGEEGYNYGYSPAADRINMATVEIVGNRHQNPELLK